ncbi:MAG: GspH/FimT family pseudopilin [Rhodocyclaceae bacterium]|nr:GspH/FimT family pseudopilin [Rhodocyclaceae bacterium]
MITVTILAILLGIGVPSFLEFIRNNRVSTQVNELATALNLARSEALKRGQTVTIQATDGLDLTNGWCVFFGAACADALAVPPLPPASGILQQHAALIDITAAPATGTVTFGRLGEKQSPAGNLILTLVPTSCTSGAQRARIVDLLPSGRVSVRRTACP